MKTFILHSKLNLEKENSTMRSSLIRVIVCSLFFMFFLLSHSQFSFSQFKFQGHIFYENQRSNPLENVRVSIWGNKFIRTSNSNINGNFGIELNSDFNPPFYLLCYKVGFYTRIYHLTTQSTFQDIGMKIVFIAQDTSLANTTYVCGRLEQSNSAPVPFVEVFGDYGERPVVSDEQGNFKLPISLFVGRNETLLWLEKEGFNPIIYSVRNPARYDENNPLIITLEPSPNSYNFDFTLVRSDNDQPIENVAIAIDDENVGNTSQQGKFAINKRLERDRASINTKFHHPFYSDTTVTIFLSSYTISRAVKLRPPSFKINTLVYYQSAHGTLKGIPGVEFKSGNRLINRTNSSGQCSLALKAIPGDKISVELPENKGFSPSDTSIILSRGQSSLNIIGRREPIAIELLAVDSLNREKVTDINSVGIVVNNYLIEAEKIDDKFKVITNIFDAEDELKISMKSQKYEIIDEPIKLTQLDKNEFEGTFYVKPKQFPTQKEQYSKEEISRKEPGEGILILDSEPREARIYINNVAGNYTPDTLQLFEGFHSITLTKEGYVSVPMVIEIKADSIINKNFVLEGPIAPLQKISEWLKVATDLTLPFLIMQYPSGNVYPFPTFRLGGHFFPLLNPDCGLKISYLASKVPSYYTSQEFGLGLFLGRKRFHWLIGFKESNFESFAKIDARFAGSSLESYVTFCFDLEDRTKERLLFLNQYSNAIVFGYEKSFSAMNKSVAGQCDKEQELYIGFMRRWKRGILNFRFGVIDPRLNVVDIEEEDPTVIKIRLSRLFIGYSYFLN